jgi:hypothetical protein
MLEHPSIRWYSLIRLSMSSDNPSGADNQQETVGIEALTGSSETARQAPVHVDAIAYGVKVQSDPHGDMRSQAEMT